MQQPGKQRLIDIFVATFVAPRERILGNEQWVYIGTTAQAKSCKDAKEKYLKATGYTAATVRCWFQDSY